jgi:hypothetical protein
MKRFVSEGIPNCVAGNKRGFSNHVLGDVFAHSILFREE